MMFQGEDRQALQTLIDNNTITPEDQLTPTHALKAIQSCIKDEVQFWHFRDEVISDFCQQPNEHMHALNTRITTLVNKCRFQDHQITETIKLTLLQHTVKFQEARDWIRLQDQRPHHTPTTHQNIGAMLQAISEGSIKGHTELTTFSVATTTASSVHQYSVTIHNIECIKYGCKHP